jgi:hypothetical protein
MRLTRAHGLVLFAATLVACSRPSAPSGGKDAAPHPESAVVAPGNDAGAASQPIRRPGAITYQNGNTYVCQNGCPPDQGCIFGRCVSWDEYRRILYAHHDEEQPTPAPQSAPVHSKSPFKRAAPLKAK